MLGFAGTILALAGKITKPMVKLNGPIIELSTKFNGLTDRIDRDGNNKETEHVTLRDDVEKKGDILNKHETDITVIKEKVGRGAI
jgi:hypothetical protein